MLHFLQISWKKKKILLYSITWPLTLNFHQPVKQNLLFLPAKFDFNPHWGNFYNMLFFSFKKGLNGQNHSSSDSHHHIKIPLAAIFSISPMGRYPRVSHRCWEHEGRLGGRGGKMMLKNICEEVHMLVKLSAINMVPTQKIFSNSSTFQDIPGHFQLIFQANHHKN